MVDYNRNSCSRFGVLWIYPTRNILASFEYILPITGALITSKDFPGKSSSERRGD